MNIYSFIGYAKDLREGKVMVVGTPPKIERRFGVYRRRYVDPRLDAHYGALHRFGYKHPDSKRQKRTRLQDINRSRHRELKRYLRNEEAYQDASKEILEAHERERRTQESCGFGY